MATLGTWLDGRPVDGGGQARAFEQSLVLIIAVEYWCRAIPDLPALAGPLVGGTVLISAAAAGVLWTRWRRPGLLLLGAVHASVIAAEFPASGNHAYFELAFVLLLALVDIGRAEERRLFLRAGRWMVCVVLAASGLQKLAHGYYSAGQFLSYTLSRDSYRDVLAPLLPATEVSRLASLDGHVGAGPYRVSSPVFLAVSHFVYIAEMVLAPLLVVRVTRGLALAAAVVLVVGIEAAAREVFFGLVMIDALLLFGSPSVQRAFVPVSALALAFFLLVRLGVLPEVTFN